MYGTNPISTNSAEDRFVNFPFGAADTQSKPYAATIPATIKNSKTIINIAQMTGAATLNLSLHPELKAGAVLIVKASADGTNRELTPGTGMTGNAYTIPASKSAVLTFEFDGTTFQNTSTILTN
jgi:hypothetical protein